VISGEVADAAEFYSEWTADRQECQLGCRLHGITEAIDKRWKCERGRVVVNQKLPAFTVGLVLISRLLASNRSITASAFYGTYPGEPSYDTRLRFLQDPNDPSILQKASRRKANRETTAGVPRPVRINLATLGRDQYA